MNVRRILALSVVAALVVVPLLWIAWSVNERRLTEEANQTQEITLVALRERLAALAADPPDAGDGPVEADVYIAGETPAIAGAVLQQVVVNAIEKSQGTLLESEILPAELAADDPGRVDLRVAFETEIMGLQNILYDLESGAPILMLRGLSVRSAGTPAEADDITAPLRVDMRIAGYQEMAP